MTPALHRKVQQAIRLIQTAVGDHTVEVSYSGGKDSDVILQLAKEAGVKYRAIYKNTTIDPPGTLAHCRKNGVEILQPKITFFHLLARKGMPTRRCRFCCEKMKEYKVLDISIQGIRRSESTARAARYSEDDPVICRIYGRNKKNHVNVILPILSWTDEDVAAFIADRHIQCHPLYYGEKTSSDATSTPLTGGAGGGAFHPERRLGCIGCPLQADQGLQDFRDNPKMFRAWCRAVKQWWDTHPHVASRTKYFTTTGMIAHNIFFRSYGKWQKADLEDDGSEVFARTHHRDWLTFLETEIGVNLKDIFQE